MAISIPIVRVGMKLAGPVWCRVSRSGWGARGAIGRDICPA